MATTTGLEEAIAAARAVATRFLTASDDELLADGDGVEQLGRLVDGWRLAFAAEAERRSDPVLGEQRLAFQHGVRDGIELVQLITRVGHREARRRVGLGAMLTPTASLLGDPVPGRHPEVSAALAEGRIGIEPAQVIASAVDAIRPRVQPEPLAVMVDALIGLATEADTEAVRDAAAEFSLLLDPDGAEPRERAQRRKRALHVGRTLEDGTTRLSMVLTPEDLAFVRELLASRRRGLQLVRTRAGGEDDPDGSGPEWRPEGDDRTRAQSDYDTALDALRAGAAATLPAPALQETVITVTSAEVEARAGQGWMPGIMAGIPMPVIERRACTGGVRLQVLGRDGEALSLGRSRRIFSPAQRRALAVAAGGRCQFGDCRVPEPYLEAHHVRWWHRDRGRTDVANGIMLCSFHHHLVHAKDSPVRIERHAGAHHIIPAGWAGPPDPAQRVRTGPPHRRRPAA